jgi:hypothetical protein
VSAAPPLKSPFLYEFLRLLASERQIPAATLADVVLYAANEKDALRFAVPIALHERLDGWAAAHGLHATGARVGGQQVGDWTVLSPEAGDDVALLVYGRSAGDVERLCAAEVDGDPAEAGRLLGYPACCIEAYALHSSSPATWVERTLARSGAGPYPCWANRLPLQRGAVTFIGELYPCSFRCEAAVAHGRRVYAAMRRLGLEGLAQQTLEQSLRPVDHSAGRIEFVA